MRIPRGCLFPVATDTSTIVSVDTLLQVFDSFPTDSFLLDQFQAVRVVTVCQRRHEFVQLILVVSCFAFTEQSFARCDYKNCPFRLEYSLVGPDDHTIGRHQRKQEFDVEATIVESIDDQSVLTMVVVKDLVDPQIIFGDDVVSVGISSSTRYCVV